MLNRPLRVFLCAPQGLARLMLRGLVETMPLLEIVGQAGTPAVARQRLAVAPVDLVLLDADQATGIDFELVRQFQQVCPDHPLVLLTLFLTQTENTVRLLQLGIRAGVDKFVDPSQCATLLLEVVRQPQGFAVVMGNYPLAEGEAVEPALPQPVAGSELTVREEKLLALLLQGRRLRTIATELNLGENTVRNYASVLYQKLQVRSKADLLEKYGRRPKG